jgi:hypothetical protein
MTSKDTHYSIDRRNLMKSLVLLPSVSLVGGCGLWSNPKQHTRFKMSLEGDRRIIKTNGIPNHSTGRYPNPHDPFAIKPQNHVFSMPVKPEAADKVIYLVSDAFYSFGIAINGVPLDPAGPYYKGDRSTGWHFEVLSSQARMFLGIDQNNAHVQPGGCYHYHGLPNGLLMQLAQANGGKPHMILLGYAADGFPIYAPLGYENANDPASPLKRLRSSYKMKVGIRPSKPGGWYDGSFVQDYEYVQALGELDECNGRVGTTPEYPKGTYHYVITDTFPFIPRYFRGKPDKSFRHPREPGLSEVPSALRNFPT